ncbi:sulfatase-like hydrolase/transferase [Urbifossiella limnaea]|uniref:Arylsulfatase n=1 Tax=Urbifossiella limnaea TaxID=2528023 RepID=A0A517XU88_9BACT|nr:sulfatase-like hydrolase/transferase [Urbifossiella limnaea]QDU21067.1 Arylsulfatase [Urbifossiella limnaea]
MSRALLALLLAASPVAAAPNLVFICSDDQRADTIAALGNRHIRTPALDRMARDGVAFTNAYCMGSTQPAVCVPSRAMFLTGRSLFRVNDQLRDLPTWPETFRRAGYHTFGVGKWHNGTASYARSFDAGGPVFFGGMSDQNKVPAHPFDPSGAYPKTNLRTDGGYSTTQFGDAAVRFLTDYRGNKPFFLYLTLTSPHDPRTPPAGWEARYDPATLPLPRNFLGRHPFDNGELKIRDEALLGWPRSEPDVRRELAAYYAMIESVDAQVGRVYEALERRGCLRNTIVIFASDHGLALGSHGLLGKQNLYEHSTKAPLLMTGPGIPAGSRSAAFVYLFDLFPTACEWFGVAPPAGVDGRSLTGVIAGRQVGVREVVFGAYRDVQRSVRTERWKLIRYPKIGRTQLFDLHADPDELRDLSTDPAHAAALREMTDRLSAEQRAWADPLLK